MPLTADHDLGRGPVVTGKQDQRVVETLHRLELVDDPPDLLVHRLDHRGMDRHLRRLKVLLLWTEPIPLEGAIDLARPERLKRLWERIGGANVALDLRDRPGNDSRGTLTGMASGTDRLPARPVAIAVFRDSGRRRLKREVGSGEGDKLEKVFLGMIDGVAAETSHRMVPDRGRSVEVVALRMRLPLHRHAAGVEEVALAGASDVERTVKSLRQRRSVDMPFARVVGAVARGFQELGKEPGPRGTRSLGPAAKPLAAVAGRQRIATNRLRIEAGEERRPARPAAGCVRGLRKPQSPARQPIEVRRVDLAAIRAEVGEAEIVGEDHHHVRSGRVGQGWPHEHTGPKPDDEPTDDDRAEPGVHRRTLRWKRHAPAGAPGKSGDHRPPTDDRRPTISRARRPPSRRPPCGPRRRHCESRGALASLP